MCGLNAVYGELDGNDLLKHRQLLQVGEIRGNSATGAVGISKNGQDFHVVKRAQAASDFVHYEADALKSVWSTKNKCVIGHNRAPTVGANSDKNAHPFVCDHIVGVHNGTLVDASLKDLPNPAWYGTDSEQMYWNIADFGVEDTFKYLWGAWANIWFDKKQNKMFAMRNDQRPLYYCYDKSLKKVWLASEKKMLDWILTRDDLSTKEVEIHQGKIYELPSHQLFSWSSGTNGRVFMDKPIDIQSGQKAPTKKSKAIQSHWKPTPSTTSGTSSSVAGPENLLAMKQAKCAHYLTAAKLCSKAACMCKEDFSHSIGPGTQHTTTSPISGTTPPKKPLLTLVKDTPKRKADEVQGIPIFNDTELKEMAESSVRSLLDRVNETIDKVLWSDNETTRNLSKENWSDFITWNKETRAKAQKMLDACDQRYTDLNRLYEYKAKVTSQVERREMIREADKAFREKQKQEADRVNIRIEELAGPKPPPEYSNTKWYMDGVFYQTLANKFKSEGALAKYMEKHYVGCANCGEGDPLNFDIANSIELMDEMGYCCDSCKQKPRVFEDIIKPYAKVA